MLFEISVYQRQIEILFNSFFLLEFNSIFICLKF